MPTTFDAILKTIHNSLRRLSPENLTITASSYLRKFEGVMPNQYKGYYPWNLAYLIKQSWLHGGTNFPLRVLNEPRLNQLLNHIIDLEKTAADILLEENDNYAWLKYLRAIANLQFGFQRNLGSWNISRNLHIFARLPANHPIRTRYRESFGMDIQATIELFFGIYSWLNQSSYNYLFDVSELFRKTDYTDETLEKFFSTITLSTTNIKAYFEENQPVKNPVISYYEKTPLAQKPFLELSSGKHLCYSKKITQLCLSSFIPDQLRLLDDDQTIAEYSRLIERYLGDVLEETGIQFIRESQLKELFPKSKVTDYLVSTDECNIFIEAKAQELSQLVRVYSQNEKLTRGVRDSVIKGAIQGYELVTQIGKGGNQGIGMQDTNYLMIVTPTQYDLGPGILIFDEFLQDSLSEHAEDVDLSLIPPQNIFVMDIEEFEMFCVSVKNHSLNIAETLHSISERSTDPKGLMFHFGQHFDEHVAKDNTFPLLDKEFKQFHTSLHGRFIDFTD